MKNNNPPAPTRKGRSSKSFFDDYPQLTEAFQAMMRERWAKKSMNDIFENYIKDAQPVTDGRSFNHINLEEIDVNLFRANKADLWMGPFATKQTSLYGGQLIGQAVAAAARTVSPEKKLHSLHAYFLRPGKSGEDVIYTVMPIFEGNSFATRSVIAQQRGLHLVQILMSFQKLEVSSLHFQTRMPTVPAPEELMTEEQRYMKIHDDARCPLQLKKILMERISRPNPIDIRFVESLDYFGGALSETRDQPTQIVWMKTKDRLSDDRNVHTSVIAYFSDLTLLATARGTRSAVDMILAASLDHALWFHSECRADEWLLFVTTSSRAVNGRSLASGQIFNREGVLCVSATQEGVLRFRDSARI